MGPDEQEKSALDIFKYFLRKKKKKKKAVLQYLHWGPNVDHMRDLTPNTKMIFKKRWILTGSDWESGVNLDLACN